MFKVKGEEGSSPNTSSGVCLHMLALRRSNWGGRRMEDKKKSFYKHRHVKKVWVKSETASSRKNQILRNIIWEHSRCFILKRVKSPETRECSLLPSHMWNSYQKTYEKSPAFDNEFLKPFCKTTLPWDKFTTEKVIYLGVLFLISTSTSSKSEPRPTVHQRATISCNALESLK